MGLNCYLCHQIVPGALDDLANHLKNDHGLSLTRSLENTGYVCEQNNCKSSFKHFYSLRRLIKDNHADLLRDGNLNLNVTNADHNNIMCCSYEDPVERSIDTVDCGEILQDFDLQFDELGSNENLPQDEEWNHNLKNYVVKMLQKFHSKSSVTGAMITEIFQECEQFGFFLLDFFKRKVNSEIQVGTVVDQNLIDQINEIFEFDSPFEGLKSFNQQISALIKNTSYIEPLEILLGRRLDTRLEKTTLSYSLKMVSESYQYVPVIQVLKLVLSDKKIREYIDSEEPSPDGFLFSSIDGQFFKTHPFFQKYANAIRIKLYYDELEVVNPLGSKTTIHKQAAFYYQIDNLPDKMNYNLASIHVLLLCNHEDIVKYGFHKVLEPFFQELHQLESDEGISFIYDDENYIVRGSLLAFCGDGLAVHEIYNHLSPSANLFCRMCLYTRQQLHSKSLEKATSRSKQVYDDHMKLLTENNFSDEMKTITGIKGESSLNQSRFFHISCNKNFDIMHDFLCGICPMIVKLCLHQWVVVEKKFDCAYLNSAISLFDYGYVEKKK